MSITITILQYLYNYSSFFFSPSYPHFHQIFFWISDDDVDLAKMASKSSDTSSDIDDGIMIVQIPHSRARK
jgi:hypothetical protein